MNGFPPFTVVPTRTGPARSGTGRQLQISRRGLLLSATATMALTGLAACGGGTGPTGADDTTAPSPAWQMPEPGTFSVTEHTWIPMPDGVRLSARLWLPDGADTAPVPAVLEYIPYRKRDLYRGHDDVWGPVLASHGIAYARVDVRGSGDSEGVITDEYSEAELDDGVAIIDWLSQQSWCSGSVGMRGISWGGINTLQIAARRPAALKAIMAIGCCDNRYTNDAHYVGGALGHTNFQWGVLFKGVMAGPPDPEISGPDWEAKWRERLEATPPILGKWTENQTFNDYWQRGSVAVDYGAIQVPTYVVGGWQDTYSNPIGRLLENLDVPRKGLVGPWGHTYPYLATPVGLDWAGEEVRWWAEWLKGETTGIMDEPMLHAFMPYATAREVLPEPIPGRWIAEETWPARQDAVQLLHFNPDGLGAAPVEGAPLTVASEHIVGLTKPEWLDRLPIEQSHDDANALVLDGKPLAEDLEILGYPRARLRVSASAPSAKIAVRLCEVTPEGQSWLVGYGLLNLTHRDSHTAPEPLEPGTAYDVDVTFFFVAHRFKQGNTIRVAISESLWPMVWPTPGNPSLEIATGVSALELPVRPQEAEPAEMPVGEVHSPASPPAEYTPALPDETGLISIDNDTPAYAYPIAEVGTQLGGERREHSEIVEGDPQSCFWRQTARTSWQRGDWNCELREGYELRSDAGTFYLKEWLIALKDGQQIFEREHEAEIDRKLL